MNQKIGKRWFYMALAMLTLFISGLIYAWSVLKSPLAAEFGWNPTELSLNYTLTMCFFCIGGLVSGLCGKISRRVRAAAAAVCSFVGFGMISRMSGEHLITLYIGYGTLCGFGIGVIYNLMVGATQAWFPDKKGLCSGLLMMCFGLSSLALGKISDALFRMEAVGWRTTYLILGCALAVVMILGGFIVNAPGKGVVLPAAKAKKTSAQGKDHTPVQMLKTGSFWMLAVYFVLLSAFGTVVFSFAKDYLVNAGVSDQLAVTMVGLVSLCNGLGRISCGLIYDRFGIRCAQTVVCLLGIAASLLCVLAAGQIPWLACLCCGLCGFCFGFSPTLTVSCVNSYYGAKDFALNLGIMNLVLIPSSFSANIAGAFISNAGGYSQAGGYSSSFIMLAAFATVALVMALTVKKPSDQ